MGIIFRSRSINLNSYVFFFICLSKVPGTFRVWCHILRSTPMQANSSEGLISKPYPICFIFENLLKTFETIKKVLSCLKIPPTCMRFDHFANCENIVPQFQTPLILAAPLPSSRSPHPPSSFYYCEGLENKLSRAPLLGLGKSIYCIGLKF